MTALERRARYLLGTAAVLFAAGFLVASLIGRAV